MTAAGERLIAAAKEMRTMAKIPEDIMAAAIRALMVPEHEMVESVSRAILAAEQRGEQRERARIAAALEHEASVLPCGEDATVLASAATLVRADFSHEEAERLAVQAAAIRKGSD